MILETIPFVDKDNKAEIVAKYNEIQDNAALKDVIYQLCLQVVIGKTQTDVVNSILSELVKNNALLVNTVCDVLGALDIESLILEKRQNFLNLVLALANRTVAVWLLKERLEYSTLAELEIIPNEKTASTKLIKLKTKLFYKQQKFNLLREESEGYSKLITELAQAQPFDHAYVLNSIKSLIGCFNLDPNRVLDIILECFETRPHHKDLFIPLIKNFLDNPLTLNQIIAFKFRFYNTETNPESAPQALFDVTAHILHNGLISIDKLYPYLAPLDTDILRDYQKDVEDGNNYGKKIAAYLAVEGAKQEDMNIYEDEKTRSISGNQKLGLVLSLIKLGDWSNASSIINRLPEHYVLSFPSVTRVFCRILHYLIDPFYRSNSGLPTLLSSRIRPYRLKRSVSNKQIESIDEFKTTIFPMLLALGPYLYRDTLLFTKIIRICRSSFATFRYDIMNLLNVSLLPAFSLVESSSSLAEELWSLLKLFPYNERYLLYNSWRIHPTNPMLMKMKFFIMRRIKYIMKRISKDKESIKQSGRVIGKLSHSNPTYLFEYILSQIQSYDNLIGPVVDCLKFLSSISYDVLLFCIIEGLSNPAKEQSKHEGNTISSWLLSLANFSGAVVKKYPIELPGLLQFIANQLKMNKSLDLLILKEIVQKMTGIEISVEMTDEQLEAMSGGELLRSEGGSYNTVRNIRKSTQRLKDALLEYNLAMPLCILMAQQRNCIVFESEHTHLKLIGKLYDQTQDTLVQYGNFLSNSLTIDDYKRRLPSLKELLTDYHLSADATFFLYRPKVSHDINSVFEEFLAAEKDRTKSIEMKLFNRAVETIISPLVDSVMPILSSQDWVDFSPKMFMSFWTLSMYDIKVPQQSYLREKAKLNKQIQDMEEQKDLPVSKKRKERERLQNIMSKLTQEMNQQKEHYDRVMHRLELEKEHWFGMSCNKVDLITRFLQHCLFPRCKFTASDAIYCAHFVHLLHSLKTPYFSTLICFDRIFGDISYTMCSCTENEANNYGRFLCAIMALQSRWHRDIQNFKTECDKYPGFVTKYSEKDPVHIDYESYRHVCHKWHYRLTKAFILCLDSGDYIQIRNSLIVLTKMLPYFPIMISFAGAIERRLEKIRNEEKEKRPDLFVLAIGYCGQLKLKKNTFVQESQFHLKEIKNRLVANASKSADSKAGSPAEQSLTQQNAKVKEEGEDEATSPVKKEKSQRSEADTVDSKSRVKISGAPSKHSASNNSSRHAEIITGGSSVDTDKKKEFRLKKAEDRPGNSSGNSSTSSSHAKETMAAPQPITETRITAPTSSRGSSEHREHRARGHDDDDHKKRSRIEVPSNKTQEPVREPIREPESLEKRSRDREEDQRMSSQAKLTSSHDRKTLRKRPSKSVIMESPEAKRKKDEEARESASLKTSTRRSDDRDTRKGSDLSKRSSSRRHKEDTA